MSIGSARDPFLIDPFDHLVQAIADGANASTRHLFYPADLAKSGKEMDCTGFSMSRIVSRTRCSECSDHSPVKTLAANPNILSALKQA
jgi:hypothetical protein